MITDQISLSVCYNVVSLLKFCCRLKSCFDLAYLLILAQSVVLIDWVSRDEHGLDPESDQSRILTFFGQIKSEPNWNLVSDRTGLEPDCNV